MKSLIAIQLIFVEVQLKKRKLEKFILGTRVWVSKLVWSPSLPNDLNTSLIGKAMKWLKWIPSKYYYEYQHACNILIIIMYLMTLKLIYLLIDFQAFNYLLVLEQVRNLFRTPGNMYFFTKITCDVIVNQLTILSKRPILGFWLGLECVPANGYNTVHITYISLKANKE